MIFENTVGLYLIAKKSQSGINIIKKCLSIPNIHASILGIIFASLKWNYDKISILSYFAELIRYSYIVLGMFIVGLTLSSIIYYLKK